MVDTYIFFIVYVSVNAFQWWLCLNVCAQSPSCSSQIKSLHSGQFLSALKTCFIIPSNLISKYRHRVFLIMTSVQTLHWINSLQICSQLHYFFFVLFFLKNMSFVFLIHILNKYVESIAKSIDFFFFLVKQ